MPYASLLQDSLLQAPLPAYLASVLCVIIAFIQRCVGLCFIPLIVWSGLCFIPRRSGLVWSGLVCVLYPTSDNAGNFLANDRGNARNLAESHGKFHTGYIYTLAKVASAIVDKHVDLVTEFRDPDSSSASNPSTDPIDPIASTATDRSTVYNYTREVISLGLLYFNFKDAVREGDGERVLLMWKYFLSSEQLDIRTMPWKH